MYWQKVKFYIRVFPVNKDCNRDMARYSSVFDTNPPATACPGLNKKALECRLMSKQLYLLHGLRKTALSLLCMRA